MMTKSATALRWAVHRYFSAIPVIVEIGTASFGSSGGSSLPYFFSRRAMGRSRERHVVDRDIRPEHTFGRRL